MGLTSMPTSTIRFLNHHRAPKRTALTTAGCLLAVGILVFLAMVPLSEAQPDQPPVRIGAIFGQTGQEKDFDRPLIQAMEDAVAELNRNGGLLGRPVELLIFDDGGTPIGARNAARKAGEAGISAVIGASMSSHSLAAAHVLQQAQIPMISPTSTNPAITLVGGYIFRVCYQDRQQGAVIAHFAHETLSLRRVAVIPNLNSNYSIGLAGYFRDSFLAMGGAAVMEDGYLGQTADFGALLARVLPFAPEAVFLPGYTRDSGLFIRQAVRTGLRIPFLGGDGWTEAVEKYAGPALDGSYCTTHWRPSETDSRPDGRVYRTFLSPLVWDAVGVLAEAIERTGSDDPEMIRRALTETRDYQGATGAITFDSNGDPVSKPVNIMKFENGGWRLVKVVQS